MPDPTEPQVEEDEIFEEGPVTSQLTFLSSNAFIVIQALIST